MSESTQTTLTPEPITAGELVKPLADSMPPVTEQASQQVKPETVAKPETAPENATPTPKPSAQAMGRDSRGVEFDPTKHRPEKNILGHWKTIGGGRPKGQTSKKPETAPKSNQPKPPAPSDPDASVIPPDEPAPETAGEAQPGSDRYALAAEAYLFAGYSLLDGAFAGRGEWMPDNAAEHEAMKGALTAWLRSRQSEDLPPGAAFALAAVGYGAKRFQRPNTQTRWRMYWLYLRAWWGNRAARAKVEQIQDSAATLAAQKAAE